MVEFLKRPGTFDTPQLDDGRAIKSKELLLPQHNFRCLRCFRVMQLKQMKERYSGRVEVLFHCSQCGTQTGFKHSVDFTTE